MSVTTPELKYPSEAEGAADFPWLSAHLFLAGEAVNPIPAGDAVLLEIVKPFIRLCRQEGWIQRFFFIRFSHLGHHIRLRLQGTTEMLESKVRPALEEMVALKGDPWTDEAGAAWPSRQPLLAHVRWITYEPEVDRYAGPVGIHVAEDLFEASSDAVLELLSRPSTLLPEGRSATTLLALTSLLHSLSEGLPQALSIAREYSRQCLQNVERGDEGGGERVFLWDKLFAGRTARQSAPLGETLRAFWQAMEAEEELPEPWAELYNRLKVVRHRLEDLRQSGLLVQKDRRLTTWQEVAEALLPHYVHMMSNRFGNFALEEAYLGHLAACLLAEGVDASIHQPDSKEEGAK